MAEARTEADGLQGGLGGPIGVPVCHVGTECTFSRAVRAGRRPKDWNTKLTMERRYAKRAFRSPVEMSLPSTLTRPDVGVSRAPTTLRSVVFPDPHGPSTTKNSPAAT